MKRLHSWFFGTCPAYPELDMRYPVCGFAGCVSPVACASARD